MKNPLTPKQKAVFEAVQSYFVRTGYMPSVREIAEAVRASVSTVHGHLGTLQKKGWIVIDGTARGIQLAEDRIPEVGTGDIQIRGLFNSVGDIEISDRPMEKVPLARYASQNGIFGIRVSGSALRKFNMIHGDIILVDPNENPTNVGMVIARKGRKSPSYQVSRANQMKHPSQVAGTVIAILREFRK